MTHGTLLQDIIIIIIIINYLSIYNFMLKIVVIYLGPPYTKKKVGLQKSDFFARLWKTSTLYKKVGLFSIFITPSSFSLKQLAFFITPRPWNFLRRSKKLQKSAKTRLSKSTKKLGNLTFQFCQVIDFCNLKTRVFEKKSDFGFV